MQVMAMGISIRIPMQHGQCHVHHPWDMATAMPGVLVLALHYIIGGLLGWPNDIYILQVELIQDLVQASG